MTKQHILLISIAVGGLSFFTSGCEKWQLDQQVRERCAKDGGIKIYETVKLPPNSFDQWGMVKLYTERQDIKDAYRNDADGIHMGHALGTEYLFKSDDYFYRKGDLLDGGAGNDNLYGDNAGGASGNDTYVFGWGYGQDTIYDYGSGEGGDTVRMRAGVSPADVTVTRDQGNLYLNLGNGADHLALGNWFGGDDGLSGGAGNDGQWRIAA